MLPSLRISQPVYESISIAVFSVAILAATTRTIIRLRYNGKVAVDDWFLVFAVICLVATFVLTLILENRIYLVSEIQYTLAVPRDLGPDVTRIATFDTRCLWAVSVTAWVTMYAVKFCFLSFFRALVDRLPRLVIYWKFTVVFTALCFPISVCQTFIVCPQLGLAGFACLEGAGFQRTLEMFDGIGSLDVLTDLMIIATPILLLRNVKIRARQKIGICIFLCLSIFMVIVAIVRIVGVRTPVNTFDLIWTVFWQQAEASVAVTAVSLSSFRTMLVAQRSKQAGKKSPRKSTKPSPPRSPFKIFHKASSTEPPDTSSSHPDNSFAKLTLGTKFHQERLPESRSDTESFAFSHNPIPSRGFGVSVDDGLAKETTNEINFLESEDEDEEEEVDHKSDKPSTASNGTQTFEKEEKHQNTRSRKNWWDMGILTNFSGTSSTSS